MLYAILPENKRFDVLQDIHLVLTQAVRSTRNCCDGEEKGRFYCAQNEESVVNNLTPSREDHNFDGEEKSCFDYTQNEESVINNLTPFREDHNRHRLSLLRVKIWKTFHSHMIIKIKITKKIFCFLQCCLKIKGLMYCKTFIWS